MISVVIPLYNKSQSIESAVRSVLDQTLRDFELIVVDDGSTDGSADIVERIADSRLRLIRKTNGGVSSARNTGICNANGEYVAFLDADDLWDSGFLECISSMTGHWPDAGIYGTSYRYLADGTEIPAEKPLAEGFCGIVDNSQWTLAHIYCSSAVCCSRRALERVGMFDTRISYGEDLDVWWRIMLEYPAAFCNRELATYRFDQENRAMKKRIPLQSLYISYFEKYAPYRQQNTAFRHFIDKECMWWLFPYFLADRNDSNVRRILDQIDLCEYKPGFRLRFRFPRLYNFLKTKRK